MQKGHPRCNLRQEQSNKPLQRSQCVYRNQRGGISWVYNTQSSSWEELAWNSVQRPHSSFTRNIPYSSVLFLFPPPAGVHRLWTRVYLSLWLTFLPTSNFRHTVWPNFCPCFTSELTDFDIFAFDYIMASSR